MPVVAALQAGPLCSMQSHEGPSPMCYDMAGLTQVITQKESGISWNAEEVKRNFGELV